MLAGTYHTLRVERVSDHGLYLIDEEGQEVLLPNRYVSLENKVGDMMQVFVYHDSEDRLIATTEKPLAAVGDAAYLKVIDKTVHGAFLDWGLTAKDIFLPNRNMSGHVEAEKSYVVYVYRDNITGRAVASMKLNSFISNEGLELKRGQEISILVAYPLDRGFRVVIDNRNWGMLYNNQIFGKIAIGERRTAYVRKVTEDKRVDVSLQREGYNEVISAADRLMAILKEAGGHLGIGDASDPEKVAAITGMSKKVFKRAAGYLLSRGQVALGKEDIKLEKK